MLYFLFERRIVRVEITAEERCLGRVDRTVKILKGYILWDPVASLGTRMVQ